VDQALVDQAPVDQAPVDQAPVDQATTPDMKVVDATGSVPQDLPIIPPDLAIVDATGPLLKDLQILPKDQTVTPDSSAGPVVKWSSSTSAGGSQGDRPTGIAVDYMGRTIVTGTFMSTASFGSNKLTSAGYADLFVAMNAFNSWNWAAGGGSGFGSEWGMAVTTDLGGTVYVAGMFESQSMFGTAKVMSRGGTDGLVASVNPISGTFSWVTPLGGTGGDNASAITMDNSGNIIVAGHFNGTGYFGTLNATSKGYSDIFVAQVDITGKVKWVKTGGSTGSDFARSVAVDSSGNITVTGNIGGAATFGSKTTTHAGSGDIFVAQLSSAGAWSWAVSAGGAGLDEAYGLSMDSSGNATVTGIFSSAATFGATKHTSKGQNDIHVTRVDKTGKISWALAVGGTGTSASPWEWGRGIACTTSGVCYVTGAFINTATFGPSTLTSKGSTDVFIAKVNPAGTFAWATQAGGTQSDSGYGLALGASGKIYVTGEFTGKGTFGAKTLTATGMFDAFVAELPKQ